MTGPQKSCKYESQTDCAHSMSHPRVATALTGASAFVLVGVLSAIALSAIALCIFEARGVEDLQPEAVVAALAREGLNVDPESVQPVATQGSPRSAGWFVMLARRGKEPADLYVARLRPDVIGDSWIPLAIRNLSKSSGAEEVQLRVVGPYAVYAARTEREVQSLVVMDLEGEPSFLTDGWPWHAKLQNAVTNLQLTGRHQGVGVWRYRFKKSPKQIKLDERARGGLEVLVDKRLRLQLDPRRPMSLRPDLVELEAPRRGRPGYITWLVDTVRELSWVGPERIAWLEHHVLGSMDWLRRRYYGAFKGALDDAANELIAHGDAPPMQEFNVQEAVMKWPPKHLTPLLEPAAKGEGQWVPVAKDPFVQEYPNAPPAFYQTFLRVDEERAYAPVYITIWDSRQVQLHILMGTREPESATGETGTGMIPRDDETFSRLVAAFNGGFQALHGEFGMMTEGRVYLPPKPWAATVAVFEDGRVGMGSWPPPPKGTRGYSESWAVSQVPEKMTSMRQNLTSVVEDDRYNPWKRWWWGAAPKYARDQTYTHRTGLCLTKEGHLAFFWGTSMGPESLGSAMLAADCVRGMHLDMNSGHCGFEFYRAAVRQSAKPLHRKLEDWEAEEQVDIGKPVTVRARKAVKSMSNMRFPRYLARDPRDFFYLTLKPLLPGPAVAHPHRGGATVSFSTTGLPHAGWPYPFARATAKGRVGQTVRLLRLDSRQLVTARAAKEARVNGQWLATFWKQGATQGRKESAAQGSTSSPGSASPQPIGLYSGDPAGRLVPHVGPLLPDTDAWLVGQDLERAAEAQYAVGVDKEGFIIYLEQTQPVRGELARWLRAFGAKSGVALAHRLALRLRATDVDLAGAEVNIPEGAQVTKLVAEERPAAGVIFPETKPRPYRVWGYLQGRRVRYVPQHPPTFRKTGAGKRTDAK